MLLTLAIRSLRTLLSKDSAARLTLLEVPEFAIKQLTLRGLNVHASMLAGRSLQELDRLRDRADKSGCPFLVLVEDNPLPFTDSDRAQREAAAERVRRLAVASSRLGCNALALQCEATDTPQEFEMTAEALKSLMPAIERQELNVLLEPHTGLTEKPERLTDLIKRIGGWRIGSLPDFGHAAACGDPVDVLRKLAPYAGVVHATVQGFSRNGKHKGYDLAQCVAAIRSVGFLNTLAIDYVGNGDPIPNIERARAILQEAIDVEPD